MTKTASTLSLILALALLTGCEDMMTKHIKIENSDFATRLAVSATLNTEGGTLAMSIYEAQSLARYNPAHSNGSIIRTGTAALYRNGEQVWSVTGKFDVSNSKNPLPQNNDGTETYQHITVTGLPVEAGSEYRLEIDIEGYDRVASTAIMPSDPAVSDILIDTVHTKTMNSVYYVSDYSIYTNEWYPLQLQLADGSSQQDYYEIEVGDTLTYMASDTVVQNFSGVTVLGVNNPALIQDNPDFEAAGNTILDTMGETYDVYAFRTLIVSDLTFQNSSTAIEMYAGPAVSYELGYYSYPPSWKSSEPKTDYDPETDGTEYTVKGKVTLTVKHISAETFRHYRSLVLQGSGMGIFSEPVTVVSNIENGYGCFSLQNTKTYDLVEYTQYQYDYNYDPYYGNPYYE